MRAVFYTEGGGRYGLGHIVRCASLAAAMRDFGIETHFTVNGGVVDGFLSPNSYKYNDWKNFTDFAACDIAVIDSYEASLSVYKAIKSSSQIAVSIDDEIRLDYPTDIILNSTVGAESWNYPQNGAVYLLGSKYFLMRSRFGEIKTKNIKNKVENIVIALGGSDVLGVAEELSKVLIDAFADTKKILVVGPGFKNKESLQALEGENFECACYPNEVRLAEDLYSEW